MNRAIILIIFIAIGFLFSWNTQVTQEIFERPAQPEITIIQQPPPPPPSAEPDDQIQKPKTILESPKPAQAILPPVPPKLIERSELYAKGVLATVNFLCKNTNDTYTLATGAIIDRHGYIISNAHIVDKKNMQPTCVIRAGSPAKEIGEAKLVFMPNDYHTITDGQQQARMDISIWKLTGTKSDWSYWEIDFDNVSKKDDQLFTQSYPAELLSSEIILKNLWLTFSSAIISEVDGSVIASRATIAAQHGSSGGVLIEPYTGKLRGIIFAISSDTIKAINERLLYAIAPAQINALVWKETKKQFGEYLAALPEPVY